jgi:hypothetical protein
MSSHLIVFMAYIENVTLKAAFHFALTIPKRTGEHAQIEYRVINSRTSGLFHVTKWKVRRKTNVWRTPKYYTIQHSLNFEILWFLIPFGTAYAWSGIRPWSVAYFLRTRGELMTSTQRKMLRYGWSGKQPLNIVKYSYPIPITSCEFPRETTTMVWW